MKKKMFSIISSFIIVSIVFTAFHFLTFAINNSENAPSEINNTIDSEHCYHTGLYEFDDETMTVNGVYYENKIEPLLASVADYRHNHYAIVLENGSTITTGYLKKDMVVQIFHNNELYGTYIIRELLEPFPTVTESEETMAAVNTMKAIAANNISAYGFTLPIDGLNINYSVSSDIGTNYGGSNTGRPDHKGTDYSRGIVSGTPVRAVKAGTVVTSVTNYGTNSYGNYVKIDHGGGYATLYAHMKYAPTVAKGSSVAQGQIIGYVGNTGNVSPLPGPNNPNAGTHLHFECIVNGIYKNPRIYLTGANTYTGNIILSDGDFISYNGSAYRIAGGAPIYVSNWDNVGGYTTPISISSEKFNSLPQYPSDGTTISANGSVYIFAGGAPLAVNNWDNIGGPRSCVNVDINSINRSDYSSAPWNHVRQYPADGTFVVGNRRDGSNTLYRFAGGAPLYLDVTLDVGYNGEPCTVVDDTALNPPSYTGYYNHVRQYPADSTFVRNSQNTIFQFHDGIATYVYSFNENAAHQSATIVDLTSYDRGNSFTSNYNLLLASGATNTISLKLLSSSDKDIFSFTAPITGNYQLYSSDCVGDMYGELYDSSQILIAQDNNTSENFNFKITYKFTAGQTYYILIRNSDNSTLNYGNYSLNILVP